MRVVIFTAGTEGDARPHAALGDGLRRRGHDVTVVTDRTFERLVRDAGLSFAPLTADFQDMMSRDRDRFDGKPQIQVALHGLRRLRDMAANWAAEGLPPAKGADLIVGSGPALYLGASIAEALDIPFVRTMLQPIEPAREITPLLLGARSLPGRMNLALHGLTRNATWQLARPAMSRVRRDLRLPPYGLRGPWRSERAGRAPLLNGFSPLVVPPSRDWGPRVATTGYWIRHSPSTFDPGERLRSFLAAGPAPVYVGFGSMVTREAPLLARLVREAVRLAGQRAIVAGGWSRLDTGDDDDIIVVDKLPHDWLFERVALAVHHCGAGTAAAAMLAGIPTVPIPFLLDQFFWAQRLMRLGVATRPLARAGMSAGDLAGAIAAAQSPSILTAAAAMRANLVREDGIANAIAALERWDLLPPSSFVATAGAPAQGELGDHAMQGL